MAKRTYYRDAKGRFASKGTPGAKAVTVDVDREKKRIKKELNSKQRAKLEEVLSRKQLKGKALTQVKKELEGMNLSELRKLTQKVGAKQPDKYRNRKDAWRQAILKKITSQGANKERLVNKSSKDKNIKAKTWQRKQLNDVRIPLFDRKLLKRAVEYGVEKPYPLDSSKKQGLWREEVGKALAIVRAADNSPRRRAELLKGGNKGSKARNIKNKRWLELQLNSDKLGSKEKALLRNSSQPRPYPFNGTDKEKNAWLKRMKKSQIDKVTGNKPVEKKKASKEELLANGNAGSKKRNLEMQPPKWVQLQLKNPEIKPKYQELLKLSPKPEPFPVDGLPIDHERWARKMRASIDEAKPKKVAYTAKNLIDIGAKYADKHLKLPSREQEDAIEAELVKVRGKMSKVMEEFRKGKASQDSVSKLAQKILSMEEKQLELVRKRRVEEEETYKVFMEGLKNRSGVSREAAVEYASKVSIESSIPKALEKGLREDLADLYQLAGGKLDTLTRLYYKDDRAYADFDGINIGKMNPSTGHRKNTLYHEVGHHMEYSDDRKLKAAIEYRNMMATSGKIERLKDIDSVAYKNTSDGEVAMRGKYITPYAGKYYSHPLMGGEYATEITSMALERLGDSKTVSQLMRKAPEHLHFILGVLTYDS